MCVSCFSSVLRLQRSSLSPPSSPAGQFFIPEITGPSPPPEYFGSRRNFTQHQTEKLTRVSQGARLTPALPQNDFIKTGFFLNKQFFFPSCVKRRRPWTLAVFTKVFKITKTISETAKLRLWQTQELSFYTPILVSFFLDFKRNKKVKIC